MSLMRNHVLVELEQPGSDDTIELTVVTDNRDRVRYDVARSRHGWPTPTEAPTLWATVCAYYAVKRSGEFQDLTVEQFIERAIEVRMVNPDGSPLTRAQIDSRDSGGVAVDPTRPDPRSGN